MEEETRIERSFSRWRIWLAIGIGLSVAVWMLYRSLSEKRFIEVEPGTGNFAWVDANHNGKADVQLSTEFIPKKGGNYRLATMKDAVGEIDWRADSVFWLGMAILFVAGRDFFYILRIRLLTKRELSWKSSFNVIMLWEFASALTPGVIGGASVAMFILNREKIDLGRSTAIVFVATMMDNLFYILMIPFVFLFISRQQLFPADLVASEGVQWIFWTGYSIFIVAFLFFFLSIFSFPQLATSLLSVVFNLPFLKRWREGALQTGRNLALTSQVMRKEPFFYWVKLFVITSGSWLSRFLVVNMLMQVFVHLSFTEHILILGKQLVMWLFMRVSPTPGGSGMAEYTFGELLKQVAISPVLLTGIAIIWRLISYFPYLFIGAFLFPRWLKNKPESAK